MGKYKVFDFRSGNSYLIGEFENRQQAEAYCREQGFAWIPKTLVRLTEAEYRHALDHRKDNEKPKYKLRREVRE